ncbi:MAG TPA: hypothetical protein VK146_14015 [Tabrizicola sp.]|nr:hypothetical protein [Tabrizicola sp.]
MDKLRVHRREEAARGFPLLRECPSTLVLRRLIALDALTLRDREDYADELSALAEAQAAGPLGQAEREALVKRLPVVAEVERAVPTRPDLRFQTVKSLARLAADPGGIEAFVRLQGLTGEAAGPPVPHVPSFADAVPVTPAKLRKTMAKALQARFGGKVETQSSDLDQLRVDVPRGRMVLNLGFAGKSWGAMSRQFDYSLWADLDGVRMVPTSYEDLWLLPAQWDLLTAGNVEAAAAHLVKLVEVRLALA